MAFVDKDGDGKVVDDVLEDAGKAFGRFAKGFLGVAEELSEKLLPVIESMLIAMAEAWARRVVEKNT